MNLDQVLIGIQAIAGILLVSVILLQARGAGLSETFGGSGAFYGTRRGPEKTLHSITIGLATLFVLLSFVTLFL